MAYRSEDAPFPSRPDAHQPTPALLRPVLNLRILDRLQSARSPAHPIHPTSGARYGQSRSRGTARPETPSPGKGTPP
jgi:hypothetical protein